MAELSDDRSGSSEFVSGHSGEEVMFDLVVEAAVQEVGHRVGFDVAGGQDLGAYEVQRVVGIQDQHAFVVRREYHAIVDSE